MSSGSDEPGGPDQPDMERLVEELREFTEGEADVLEALAAHLSRLRSALPDPSFDVDAIWATIERKLEEGEGPASDDES